MTDRTVSVHTRDRGTVTVPEPAWCVGDHEDGLSLADLVHDGPTVEATVTTPLGDLTILDACLTRYPYSANRDDRGVKVAVFLGNEWFRFAPDGLRMLAAELAVHAVRLRDLAAQLAAIEAEEAGQ